VAGGGRARPCMRREGLLLGAAHDRAQPLPPAAPGRAGPRASRLPASYLQQVPLPSVQAAAGHRAVAGGLARREPQLEGGAGARLQHRARRHDLEGWRHLPAQRHLRRQAAGCSARCSRSPGLPLQGPSLGRGPSAWGLAGRRLAG
jgi:hypothetical protein